MYGRRAGQHHPRASHTVRGDAGCRQCGVRDGHQRVRPLFAIRFSQPSLPLTVPTEDFGPLEGYAVAVYYSPFSADLTSIFSLDFSRLPTHSSFPRRSRPSDSAAQLARIARARWHHVLHLLQKQRAFGLFRVPLKSSHHRQCPLLHAGATLTYTPVERESLIRVSLAVEPLVPPPIDTAFAVSHDALCEPPVAAAGAKVENRFLVFQARQRVVCTGRLDARVLNQVRGLACAGHGAF